MNQPENFPDFPQKPPMISLKGSGEGDTLNSAKFLALYLSGANFDYRAPAGLSREFVEIVWNAGISHQQVHVHDVQAAAEAWLQSQIRKTLCRKN